MKPFDDQIWQFCSPNQIYQEIKDSNKKARILTSGENSDFVAKSRMNQSKFVDFEG
jgi:hypothetical protein